VTLDVGLGGVHKQFRTRNTLHRPRQMDIDLLWGPFRTLTGTWKFEDLDHNGSRVSLVLEFEVAHSLLDRIFGLLFEEVIRSQINAFVERAEKLYG